MDEKLDKLKELMRKKKEFRELADGLEDIVATAKYVRTTIAMSPSQETTFLREYEQDLSDVKDETRRVGKEVWEQREDLEKNNVEDRQRRIAEKKAAEQEEHKIDDLKGKMIDDAGLRRLVASVVYENSLGADPSMKQEQVDTKVDLVVPKVAARLVLLGPSDVTYNEMSIAPRGVARRNAAGWQTAKVKGAVEALYKSLVEEGAFAERRSAEEKGQLGRDGMKVPKGGLFRGDGRSPHDMLTKFDSTFNANYYDRTPMTMETAKKYVQIWFGDRDTSMDAPGFFQEWKMSKTGCNGVATGTLPGERAEGDAAWLYQIQEPMHLDQKNVTETLLGLDEANRQVRPHGEPSSVRLLMDDDTLDTAGWVVLNWENEYLFFHPPIRQSQILAFRPIDGKDADLVPYNVENARDVRTVKDFWQRFKRS